MHKLLSTDEISLVCQNSNAYWCDATHQQLKRLSLVMVARTTWEFHSHHERKRAQPWVRFVPRQEWRVGFVSMPQAALESGMRRNAAVTRFRRWGAQAPVPCKASLSSTRARRRSSANTSNIGARWPHIACDRPIIAARRAGNCPARRPVTAPRASLCREDRPGAAFAACCQQDAVAAGSETAIPHRAGIGIKSPVVTPSDT